MGPGAGRDKNNVFAQMESNTDRLVHSLATPLIELNSGIKNPSLLDARRSDPYIYPHKPTPGKPTYLNLVINLLGPPLWSSGQSSWLQIQRSGLDSRRYQIFFWEVVGLERGPLCIVIIMVVFFQLICGSGIENLNKRLWGNRCADHATPSIR
jgi:hypothetical protein